MFGLTREQRNALCILMLLLLLGLAVQAWRARQPLPEQVLTPVQDDASR